MLATFPSAFATGGTVEINLQEAGTLASKLEEMGVNVKTVTDLTVTGTINQEDFRVMSKIMTSLMSVDISGTDITAIPDNAFDGKSILQKCIVPEGLQTIGNYAFRNCSGLINQPFGQKIESIGNYAFDGCNNMKGDIVFPTSLTLIGNGAFQYCSMLTSVDMSEYESYRIPSTLFRNCYSVRTVILPEKGAGIMSIDNMYYIDYAAFDNTGITEITIPTAVTRIEGSAFDCSQLKTINMQATTPPSIEEYTFGWFDKSACMLNVPTGSLKAYSYATNWSAFPIIEEIGIQTEIGANGSILYNGKTVNNGTVIFHHAKETTFKLIPNPGYKVDKALFNKQEIPVTENTIKVGSGIKSGTLKVDFVLKKFNLNITTQGNGKLKFNDELLATQQTLLVDSASSVMLNLLPDEGYAVKSILYNKVEGVAQQNQSVYTTPFAEGNADLVVTYASKEEIGEVQKLSIKIGTNGNVIYKNTPLLQESDIIVTKGEPATFTILPNKYYMIDKVLYNKVDVTTSVSKEGVYTTDAVNMDGALEVSFRLNPVITVNVGNQGELKDILTEEQMKIVTHLTLIGSISESDFMVMRDDMVALSVIDMSKATAPFGGAWEGGYIPYNAFSTGSYESSVGKKTLTEVKLPINISTIGGWAFANCTNLKSVNFDECLGLNNIEDNAFRGTGLTTIDLSKTKISSLTNGEFSKCTTLSEVKLPNTLQILSNAFGESGVKSLDLSICEKLTTLEYLNCQSLESVIFPNNLETIGSNAFHYTKLQLVDLSVCNKLKRIGEGAFQSSPYLQEIKLPVGIETIRESAFSGCQLKSLDLSACTALTQINANAFSYNSSLNSVKFPATLTSLGNDAFAGCGLSGILELPAPLLSIGERAFANNSITICKIEAMIPPTLGKETFGGDMAMGTGSSLAAVFVPENSVKAYKNADGWNEFTILGGENKVEVNVTKPGNLAIDIMDQAEISPALVTHLTVHGALNSTDFGVMRSNMSVLYSLDLSDADAEIIPQEAFLDKKILMEFKAPKNLAVIESRAFSGCTALGGTIELPNGVTTIGDQTFANCSSMTSIKFSDNLLRIGSEAFSGCTGLNQEITFPAKLRTIGWNAFSNCSNLFGTLTLPASLESLGASAFQGCTNLQKVDMSACTSLTEISDQIFSNCSNLKEIQFPEKLQYIRSNAFNYCPQLNNLKFPSTLYTIDSYAFNGCSNLAIIDLSACNLLNSISEYAFANCSALTTLNLPVSLTNIGGYAFSQCRALANINAANAVPAQLGDYVFQRVNTEVCILSIPTDSYNDYLTAQQWGAFVQLRKAIAININDEGGNMEYTNNANVENEEDIEVANNFSHVKAQITSEKRGAIATNGSSIYVKKNETVSFFITPKDGYAISKVMYNDNDVTSEVINGVYTTPKVTDKANLKVSFGSAIPVTGVSLNKNSLTLAVSKSETLIATVTPSESVVKSVVWTSDKPEIATVDADGLVTAVMSGNAKITVTTVDGGFTATCDVTVVQPVTGISLNKNAMTLNVTETEKLIATVSPELADNKAITWTSNKPEIATVDTDGLVTAVMPGNAKITVTTVDGGFTATCDITVIQPVTGISLNKNAMTLNVAETEKLIATVTPENAINKSVIWSSSNSEIATVDDNGLVTALKAGNAEITVMTVDGEFKAMCNVTVNDPSGINSPMASGAKVFVNGNTITISGVEKDVPVFIYSMSGVLISTITSEGEDILISLPADTIYVIRTNRGKAIKIAL